MAYTLYTQSLGAGYANQQVQITRTDTGVPAIVQANASGTVTSTQGFATLNGSGNLSVYIDTTYTWNVVPVIAASSTGTGSNVIVTSTVLPTGAASSANQATEVSSLSSMDAKMTTNLSSLASIDGKATTGNASTASIDTKATANNASLSSIDTKTPAKGAATIANSSPVSIASDQVVPGTFTSPNGSAAGLFATLTGYNNQRVTAEAKTIFVDYFDGGTVDVTDRWAQVGTVAQTLSTVAVGNVITLTSVHNLTSKMTFPPQGVSFTVLAFTATFETSPLSTTNVNRFIGFGTHSGTPSIGTPITDGVGFEWDAATSKLYGAIWANGTRSASSLDLTSSVTNANTRYIVVFRSDLVIFYIGTSEVPKGSINFVAPNVQNLPVRIQTVIGGSAPSVTPTMTVGAIGVGDTAGNTTQITDGNFPHRKVTVKAASTAAAATDSPLVVALHPSSPAPSVADFTATGNITAVNANLNSGVATTNSTVAITSLNGVGVVGVQIVGTYVGTLLAQISVDGSNWVTAAIGTGLVTSPTLAALTSASVGVYFVNCPGAAQIRITCNAYTSGTATVTLRGSDASVGSALYRQGINVDFVAGSLAASSSPNGSSRNALVMSVAGGESAADYSAQAWAAASGSGATIADVNGTGGVCAFDVNLTTFTAGSSTGLDIFLQWSPDNGTTWLDLWQCEALTAAGHVFIPPLYIPGRRRMRWVNRTGAATTATVTVTAVRLSMPVESVRQWFDRTAGVLAGTISNTTASYNIVGCKNLTALVTLGATTTPAFYQFQVSADGTNWGSIGTATQAVASATTALTVSNACARFARIIVTTSATSQVGTVININGCK